MSQSGIIFFCRPRKKPPRGRRRIESWIPRETARALVHQLSVISVCPRFATRCRAPNPPFGTTGGPSKSKESQKVPEMRSVSDSDSQSSRKNEDISWFGLTLYWGARPWPGRLLGFFAVLTLPPPHCNCEKWQFLPIFQNLRVFSFAL